MNQEWSDVRVSGDTDGIRTSSFARNVMALLDRVEYRRCERDEDIEAIYRLRYRAYRAHGFVPESRNQVTFDQYDAVPNCHRFGIFIDGELASTVRVHHVTREEPEAPIMAAFGDVIGPRLERGETFVNPTLLAAEPAAVSKFRAIPYLTLRLAIVAIEYFKTTSCVCVIREEHTAFYRRTFGAVQVGQPRDYPPFTVPVMLYESNCATNLRPTIGRYPFFNSTAVEQRMLFAKPNSGNLAPLTILPTAKYFRDAA